MRQHCVLYSISKWKVRHPDRRSEGDVVTLMQPNQDQNGKYWFDSSIITEFGISLAESVQPGADTY